MGEIKKLEIEYVPITDLEPYEGNAKKHSEKQIEQIAESIKELGMNDPIAVWGENNVIVEGHGRLYALISLGAEEVPIIRLDHLTDEQRVAYTLIHNKLTMNTGFDLEKLNSELMGIESLDMSKFDLEVKDLELDGGVERVDLSDNFDEKFIIEVTCENGEKRKELFDEFTEREYECRLV